ncbi:MAG: GNVR domain-containing protein [Thermodesulfobacteriota bacterium]
MDPRQQQQIKQYLNIVLRWKKTIAVCLLLGITAGLGIYLKTPKAYQATALLIYQQQKVNPAKMSPDVDTRTKEIVATLREQVLSRTNLEEVIKQFGLYREQLQKMPMEDVIDLMRTKFISLNMDRGDTFKVSFQGGTPRQVMLVTNALASKFVEENLRYREERATETSAYVENELALAKKAIEEKESAMRDYKLQHYNEMPDQRQTNISRLNALQTTYQGVQTSIQEQERTKIMVQEQISLRKNLLRQAAPELLPAAGGDRASEAYALQRQAVRDLEAMRSELAGLLSRYTPEHPEVKRLQKRIEQQEDKVGGFAPAEDETSGQAATAAPADPQLSQMELQRREIDISIGQLRKEATELKSQIETYQQWIAAAPVREAEWVALTRDYEQMNKHYEDLVAKNIEAKSAESLERKQKGSQFKVADPARLPEKPFKPDLVKIMLLAIALGLGFGCAVGFALELVDTSFKDAHDLETYLGLPILCAVPVVATATEEKRQKIKGIVWGVFLAGFAGALLLAVFLLWRKGILVI